MADYVLGFIGGLAIGMFVIPLLFGEPSNQDALDNCAKTHNVYQCEMVAVPKTGEK